MAAYGKKGDTQSTVPQRWREFENFYARDVLVKDRTFRKVWTVTLFDNVLEAGAFEQKTSIIIKIP